MSASVETLSTLASTTPKANSELPASLSRRNSRPSSLHIDHSQLGWNTGIVLEEPSPGLDIGRAKLSSIANGNLVPPSGVESISSSGLSTPCAAKPLSPILSMQNHSMSPVHSPCFVHSHLDKAAALADWMRTKQGQTNGGVFPQQPKAPLNGQTFGVQYPESISGDSVHGVTDEDEDYGSSLTRQLAETAVGVREMSKQLGQEILPHDNN